MPRKAKKKKLIFTEELPSWALMAQQGLEVFRKSGNPLLMFDAKNAARLKRVCQMSGDRLSLIVVQGEVRLNPSARDMLGAEAFIELKNLLKKFIERLLVDRLERKETLGGLDCEITLYLSRKGLIDWNRYAFNGTLVKNGFLVGSAQGH